MLYSVWDPSARSYDYYQTAAAAPTAPPDPTHLERKALGLATEEAAWPLPSDARWVGRGAVARGVVAAKRGALGSFAGGKTAPAIGFALAAWLLWRSMRRGAR